MVIKLQDIFIANPNKRLYSKEDLIRLKIRPDFIEKLSLQLELSYVENSPLEENVCLSNSIEVRPEYRTVYTKVDVIHYVCGQISIAYFELKKVEISFPMTMANFFV